MATASAQAYIQSMEQRNRVLRKLREEREAKLMQQREREAGFSVYLSGANQHTPARNSAVVTAGAARRRRLSVGSTWFDNMPGAEQPAQRSTTAGHALPNVGFSSGSYAQSHGSANGPNHIPPRSSSAQILRPVPRHPTPGLSGSATGGAGPTPPPPAPVRKTWQIPQPNPLPTANIIAGGDHGHASIPSQRENFSSRFEALYSALGEPPLQQGQPVHGLPSHRLSFWDEQRAIEEAQARRMEELEREAKVNQFFYRSDDPGEKDMALQLAKARLERRKKKQQELAAARTATAEQGEGSESAGNSDPSTTTANTTATPTPPVKVMPEGDMDQSTPVTKGKTAAETIPLLDLSTGSQNRLGSSRGSSRRTHRRTESDDDSDEKVSATDRSQKNDGEDRNRSASGAQSARPGTSKDRDRSEIEDWELMTERQRVIDETYESITYPERFKQTLRKNQSHAALAASSQQLPPLREAVRNADFISVSATKSARESSPAFGPRVSTPAKTSVPTSVLGPNAQPAVDASSTLASAVQNVPQRIAPIIATPRRRPTTADVLSNGSHSNSKSSALGAEGKDDNHTTSHTLQAPPGPPAHPMSSRTKARMELVDQGVLEAMKNPSLSSDDESDDSLDGLANVSARPGSGKGQQNSNSPRIEEIQVRPATLAFKTVIRPEPPQLVKPNPPQMQKESGKVNKSGSGRQVQPLDETEADLIRAFRSLSKANRDRVCALVRHLGGVQDSSECE